MSKTVAIVVVCLLALLAGPVIVYDIVTDYRYAAQEYLSEHKPTHAKIHEAERKINKGTESVAKLKVALGQMEREQERLGDLLARAPMPLPEMRQQHQGLEVTVAEARQKDSLIEYDGKVRTPREMGTVLARQKAELDKYERYATTIENLEKMRARTVATVSQALDERGAVKADLEYAKSLTRIAQATSVTEAPFEATVGEFRQAGEALAGVTALQEVRLEMDERTTAFAGKGKLVLKDN